MLLGGELLSASEASEYLCKTGDLSGSPTATIDTTVNQFDKVHVTEIQQYGRST